MDASKCIGSRPVAAAVTLQLSLLLQNPGRLCWTDLTGSFFAQLVLFLSPSEFLF